MDKKNKEIEQAYTRFQKNMEDLVQEMLSNGDDKNKYYKELEDNIQELRKIKGESNVGQ